MEEVFLNDAAPDSVLRWFRRTLVRDRWKIVSDLKKPDGEVELHARDGDGSAWVRVRSLGGGSRYTVVASVTTGPMPVEEDQ